MIFWGLLLIAIGVGALTDVELWPMVLVLTGAALLLSALATRRRYGGWYSLWCCWDPSYRREPRLQDERESADPSYLQ